MDLKRASESSRGIITNSVPGDSSCSSLVRVHRRLSASTRATAPRTRVHEMATRACGRLLRRMWRERWTATDVYARGDPWEVHAQQLTRAIVQTVKEVVAAEMTSAAKQVLELPTQLSGTHVPLPKRHGIVKKHSQEDV